MPLILTAPNANPIRTYKNGVKVVRLHEYLAPARGTLSTESDPWSVCGTVVRDTQTISYDGTGPSSTIQSNFTTEGNDTIRIPFSDFNLNNDFTYTSYIGVRSEGEPVVGRSNFRDTFYSVALEHAGILSNRSSESFSYISSMGAIGYCPRQLTNPHYKILKLDFNVGTDVYEDPDEVYVIKAASGTGGSLEWLLDVLYLVPSFAQTFDNPSNQYEDDDFRFLMADGFTFDPTRDVDSDAYDDSKDSDFVTWDDDGGEGLGQYSVMLITPTGWDADGYNSGMADYQEGENEKTCYNINGDNFYENYYGIVKSTDLSMIYGSQFCDSHLIEEDDFDRTTHDGIGGYLGEADNHHMWTINADHPFQASSANAGHQMDGTQLWMREGKYDGLFPSFFPWPPYSVGGSSGDAAAVILGSLVAESGIGAGTDGHPTLSGLTHATLQVKVTTDAILVAGFNMAAGFAGNGFVGVLLDIPGTDAVFGLRTSSDLIAHLVYLNSPGALRTDAHNTGTEIFLDSPITMATGTYTPGTFVWIKVEMNWYHYKAKVWFDGDTEPTDWMMQAQAPHGYDDDSPFGQILYPYLDDERLSRDLRRRSPNMLPYLLERYFRPYEDINGQDMNFSSDPVRLTSTYWQDFTLNYDSHGETPTDVHFRMKKYDDSIEYGHKIISPYSQRMVIATYGPHAFNDDEDGYSVTVWKENGAPETQCVVLSDFIEKVKHGGPIHLESIAFRPHETNELNEP